jgi:ABC-type multidrug transport system fused ATPase/permease subunit
MPFSFLFLEQPVKIIFSYWGFFMGSLTSLDRIEEFMATKDRDLIVDGICEDSNNAIEISGGKFDLIIKKGTTNVIVGSFGGGKTALVRTILGEIRKTSGVLKVNGYISYFPQSSSILNGTIRENILFGELDEERY